MSTIVDSRPRGTYIPVDCPSCKGQQEYMVPPTFIGTLRVRCGSCKQFFNHPQPLPSSSGPSASASGSGSKPKSATRGRGIGSDKNPLDMAYYDVLGLDSQCTGDEVKKAYRRLAIKLHPDKNRDDPDAEEKFKQISIAYQILSDPELRHKYNEFGQKNGGGSTEPAGGFQDPEEVFGKMFGGDKFEDLIGQISIGKDMKDAFQKEHEGEDENDWTIGPGGKKVLTPEAAQRKVVKDRAVSEEKARLRKARVDKLAENLRNRLAIFTEAARGPEDKAVVDSFKAKMRLEAEELKDESYGVELLNSIGRAYQAKASQHQASNQFAPLGWFHGARNTFNTVSDTVSTVRSAIELKQVFDKLQQAESAGLSAEKMRKLEEQAAEQGMRTLWKGAKLEVEAVVREACEQVLTEPGVPREKLVMRATALNLAADAFLAIKKEGAEPIEEFVKVETPASKQREGAGAGVGAGRPPVPPPRPETYPKEKTPSATFGNGAVPPRPNTNRPVPPTPTPAQEGEEAKQETLHAAYKAYESKRRSQNQNPPGQ